MVKLGGIICDICRVLLRDKYSIRKAKNGRIMHICEKCKEKDTLPKNN